MSSNAALKLIMIEKSVIIAELDFNPSEVNLDWCNITLSRIATYCVPAVYLLLPVSVVFSITYVYTCITTVFFPFSF